MEKSNLKNLSVNNQSGAWEEYSKILKCGRRTYFFDVKTTESGDKYLKITESKLEGKEGGRSCIFIFDEYLEEFKKVLDETAEHVKKGVT